MENLSQYLSTLLYTVEMAQTLMARLPCLARTRSMVQGVQFV